MKGLSAEVLREQPQFGVRLNLGELVDDGLDCLAMVPSDV